MQPELTELVIITGQSVKRRAGSTLASDSEEDEGFALLKELQQILIDDFYPTISTSTVPNNPGRLVLTLVR